VLSINQIRDAALESKFGNFIFLIEILHIVCILKVSIYEYIKGKINSKDAVEKLKSIVKIEPPPGPYIYKNFIFILIQIVNSPPPLLFIKGKKELNVLKDKYPLSHTIQYEYYRLWNKVPSNNTIIYKFNFNINKHLFFVYIGTTYNLRPHNTCK
jgi:hypothetical protein